MVDEDLERVLKVKQVVEGVFRTWNEVLERRREDIYSKQRNAVDVVVLMCAFLDSLANRLFWSSKDKKSSNRSSTVERGWGSRNALAMGIQIRKSPKCSANKVTNVPKSNLHKVANFP